MISTVERARGRWREILTQIGVETRFLVNKHGPCPICGGKDRFRFDDRDGSGSYYCNQCGAGVGLILVRKLRGWDFRTACSEVDKIIGTDAPAQPSASCTRDADRRARDVRRLLSEARDRSVVEAYLARRGLSLSSPVLRGHSECQYFDGHQLAGRYPAVIAPILGPDGSLQSVQRIYDAPVDPRKKTMPPVKTISGAAVRLHDPGGTELAITEGIENGLAVHEMFDLPVWAVLSAGGIKAFEPPPGLGKLHIFGDNDSNFVGQQAAYDAASRISRTGLKVSVDIPLRPDSDWLDHLNDRRAR